MTTTVTEAANYSNITSTTTIDSNSGNLLGIFVASTSAGTIKVADGSSTIVNTFSPLAATFYPMPCYYSSLVITIGGTVDCTVFWNSQA